MRPVERLFYRAAGVSETKGQTWAGYAASLIAFNAAGFALLYAIVRLQGVLPLNPLHLSGMPPHLAFNTAISFVTNTNWQSYAGESTLSNGAQMAGMTVQNFASAATGVAVVGALARAFAAHRSDDLGSFWRDLVRVTLYVLLPLSLVMAVVLDRAGRAADADPARGCGDARRREADAGGGAGGQPGGDSSRSAPMAAASSTPIPATRSRTPARSPTSSPWWR